MINPNNEVHSSEFSKSIDFYPSGFKGNLLNLLNISNASLIIDHNKYLRNICSPTLMEEQREFCIIEEDHYWPFPIHKIRSRPDPITLSHLLFKNFEFAEKVLPNQGNIGDIIEDQAMKSSPNIILLMIVDGLSYYDIPENDNTTPILVNGVSITSFGYRAIIGKPHISRRLFALGYREVKGFTYYLPQSNNLSNDLHEPFSDSEIIRVKEFDDIIKYLDDLQSQKGYIQIVTSGLDHLCHHHRDRPPVYAYTKEIFERFEQITELLRKKNLSYNAYLTSDHGILWKDLLEERHFLTSDLFTEESYSPRYVKGALLRDYGKIIQSLGMSFTLLGYPWITRRLRNDEWGVHGGISAWESIVPLIMDIS